MAFRSSIPWDPRRGDRRGASWVSSLGAWGLQYIDLWLGVLATLGAAARAPFDEGTAARRMTRRILVQQIYFTGFQALPLVLALSLLVGTTLIVETTLLSPMGRGEMLGEVLVIGILRELAPLTTTIIVAGRSGTAIVTELANMRVNGEDAVLESLGIPAARYILLPRIIGTTVSVVCLTVFFAASAIIGGALVSVLISSPSYETLRNELLTTLSPHDLPLFLGKTAGLGLLVGWFCTHFGLHAAKNPTEVPRQASRAMIATLFAAAIYNTATTVAFYSIVGPPIG